MCPLNTHLNEGFAMRMPIYSRRILAVCLIFSLQYPVTAQTTESATEEFKFCMSTCMSNSCSGPASVVEKNCSRKCLVYTKTTNHTLTTLASAAAALGKKVDLELLDQRSVLRQLIFSL